jgi:hypothetical protein
MEVKENRWVSVPFSKFEVKCYLCEELMPTGSKILWNPEKHISRHKLGCPKKKIKDIQENNQYEFPVEIRFVEPTFKGELPKTRKRKSTRALGTNPRSKGTNPRNKNV